jgi:hypothetical protein
MLLSSGRRAKRDDATEEPAAEWIGAKDALCNVATALCGIRGLNSQIFQFNLGSAQSRFLFGRHLGQFIANGPPRLVRREGLASLNKLVPLANNDSCVTRDCDFAMGRRPFDVVLGGGERTGYKIGRGDCNHKCLQSCRFAIHRANSFVGPAHP